MPSNRLKAWRKFLPLVDDHIENYTVPQYGDFPHDQLTHFSAEEIVAQMKRYVNRALTGQRGLEESQRDLLKLIHYASVLYAKRRSEAGPGVCMVCGCTEDCIGGCFWVEPALCSACAEEQQLKSKGE